MVGRVLPHWLDVVFKQFERDAGPHFVRMLEIIEHPPKVAHRSNCGNVLKALLIVLESNIASVFRDDTSVKVQEPSCCCCCCFCILRN